MRRVRIQLEGVRQRVLNHVGDVPICQCTNQVIAAAAANDQTFGAEDAETLRDRGELFVRGGHDLGDAHLAFLEQLQDLQTGSISHRTE